MAAVIAIGALGALIGSFLNVVVSRVPEGRSVVTPPSACGACGHGIRWYDNIPVLSWMLLRARCRDCGAVISVRYPLVEAGTALFLALVAWRFVPAALTAPDALAVAASILQLIAFLYLAGVSVALAIIDLETQRLPNSIVLPAYPIGIALLTVAAGLAGDWAVVGVALAASIGWALVYAIPAFAIPGAMGMGDVKLAGVLGLYLGSLGVAPALVGLVSGFLLGGVFGVVLLLLGRGRKARIAFGPWLLAGAWVGILGGDAVAEGYLGLFGLN